MKIFTAAALLSVSVIPGASALDKGESAPAKKPPTKAAPARKADPPGQPPLLTLEGPMLRAQHDPVLPDPLPHALDPGTGKPLPPGTLQAPAPDGGSTAPAITLNPGPAPLAPGVYVASPFTGIVVVPESVDQPMVKKLPQTPTVMPSPSPDLKLTPKTK